MARTKYPSGSILPRTSHLSLPNPHAALYPTQLAPSPAQSSRDLAAVLVTTQQIQTATGSVFFDHEFGRARFATYHAPSTPEMDPLSRQRHRQAFETCCMAIPCLSANKTVSVSDFGSLYTALVEVLPEASKTPLPDQFLPSTYAQALQPAQLSQVDELTESDQPSELEEPGVKRGKRSASKPWFPTYHDLLTLPLGYLLEALYKIGKNQNVKFTALIPALRQVYNTTEGGTLGSTPHNLVSQPALRMIDQLETLLTTKHPSHPSPSPVPVIFVTGIVGADLNSAVELIGRALVPGYSKYISAGSQQKNMVDQYMDETVISITHDGQPLFTTDSSSPSLTEALTFLNFASGEPVRLSADNDTIIVDKCKLLFISSLGTFNETFDDIILEQPSLFASIKSCISQYCVFFAPQTYLTFTNYDDYQAAEVKLARLRSKYLTNSTKSNNKKKIGLAQLKFATEVTKIYKPAGALRILPLVSPNHHDFLAAVDAKARPKAGAARPCPDDECPRPTASQRSGKTDTLMRLILLCNQRFAQSTLKTRDRTLDESTERLMKAFNVLDSKLK